MTAVTVANAVLARRQDSELLGLYALAGGLATPALLSMGHSNEIFLFSYLALLNAGALLLLALHPWKRLAWAALLGTAVYYIGWSCERGRPFSLAGHGFLSGAVLRRFCRGAFPDFARSQCVRRLVLPIAFPIANAAATWVALMVLFGARSQHAGRPWVTVALAGACLLMASRLAQACGPLPHQPWSGHLFCDCGRAAGVSWLRW